MQKIIIKVFGYVQGVFFRYTTRKVAKILGLTGFVKNMADGSVYIEAEGPEHARVEGVEYEFKTAQNKFKTFDEF